MKRKERNFNNIMRDAIATLQDPEACASNLENNLKAFRQNASTPMLNEDGYLNIEAFHCLLPARDPKLPILTRLIDIVWHKIKSSR